VQRNGTERLTGPSLADSAAFEVVANHDLLVEAVALRVAELLLTQQRPAEPEPYIGVEEAARYLACDRQRIYDLRSQRRLRCIKDGGRLLTRRSWIDAYLEQ
jgi:excisionase family DNA binding protein